MLAMYKFAVQLLESTRVVLFTDKSLKRSIQTPLFHYSRYIPVILVHLRWKKVVSLTPPRPKEIWKILINRDCFKLKVIFFQLKTPLGQ